MAGVVAVVAVTVFLSVPRDENATPSPTSSSASPAGTATPTDPGVDGAAVSPASPEEPAAPEETPGSSDPFPELAPVAPDEPGNAEGIAATLTRFESVTGEVVGPGDVEAAAVRVTVDITNTGAAPLDLNLIVMNAYMGPQRDPSETYEKPGGEPMSGSLAPGATATGVYLFRIPEDRRDDVTFTVDYMAGQPAITFRGPVS